MKQRKVDGRKTTPFDDGVVINQHIKYTNPETAEAEFLEDWGSDGGEPGFTDWRLVAEDMIAEAQERADLPEGAREAVRNLRHSMVYLRQFEAGQWADRQDVYGHGVSLGIDMERLRVWLDSTAVKDGLKGLNGRKESAKTRAKNKRVVDDFILRWFDKKAAQHIGDGRERDVCRYAATELNAAYQAGDREARGVLMQLKKDVFTPEMVRHRVQARKKQNG